MTKTNYDVREAVKAQREYCDRTKAPHFAPYDGRCWNCGKNIYEPIERVHGKGTELERIVVTGIKTKEADTRLVTGCPHCNRSYCD